MLRVCGLSEDKSDHHEEADAQSVMAANMRDLDLALVACETETYTFTMPLAVALLHRR